LINLSRPFFRRCKCYEIEAKDLRLFFLALERQNKAIASAQADEATSHILDDDLLDIKFSLIQF